MVKDKKEKKRWIPSKGLKKPMVTENNNILSKRKVEKLYYDQNAIEPTLCKMYPNYSILDFGAKRREPYELTYIYVRMRKME